MNHSVLFNTWNAAFFIKGGGEVQLLNSKKYLEKAGAIIDRYDMWNPQMDFDIFHQFSSVPGVEYVVEAYKKRGKKIALSPIFWDKLTPENKYYSHYENLFSMVDVFFTNSNLESDLISESFGISKEKFYKTRNSVSDYYLDSTSDNNNSFREKFDIKDDYILTVANIDERKNTQRLLKACSSLGVKLVSIGHIRHDSIFEKIKSEDSFIHLGPIADEELLRSAYQNARLFVLPSMCETPGIAALEAASQGCKIVITQEGSTQEYFKDYVTYVDPWSDEAIKEGIRIEMSKKRCAHEIADYIKENFNWENTAKDILNGYNFLGLNNE